MQSRCCACQTHAAGPGKAALLLLAVERMGKDLVLRQANLSDASSIQKCVKAAYNHYIARIGKPPGPMLDDYTEVIQLHKVFVVESIEVVGVLVLIRTDFGILLDNVAVHPGQQGRGMGKRLMHFAESEARAQGFEKLDLYT